MSPNFGEHYNSCFANLTKQSVYCSNKGEEKSANFTKGSVNITEKCRCSIKSVKLTEKSVKYRRKSVCASLKLFCKFWIFIFILFRLEYPICD